MGFHVYILLDYDMCGDLWGSKGARKYLARKGRVTMAQLDACCQVLNTHLREITQDASTVTLGSFSARQSQVCDHILTEDGRQRKQESDSSFEAMESIAAERGWSLNKLLLSDTVNAQPEGSVWCDPHSQLLAREEGEQDVWFQVDQRDFKRKIAKNHIDWIKANMDGEVRVYIYDDHKEYVEAALSSEVPRNVYLHGYRMDWYNAVERMFWDEETEILQVELERVETAETPRTRSMALSESEWCECTVL